MEFDALMEGLQDPWELESQDAVLRRALAESVQSGKTLGPAAAPSALRTPKRTPAVAPMTPAHGQVAATQRLVSIPQPAMGKRMMPFPPPLAGPKQGALPCGSNPVVAVAAVTDPYALPVDPLAGEIAMRNQGPPSLSPVNWPPKTPKVRRGVKEGAKSSGPHDPEKVGSWNPGQDFGEARDFDGRDSGPGEDSSRSSAIRDPQRRRGKQQLASWASWGARDDGLKDPGGGMMKWTLPEGTVQDVFAVEVGSAFHVVVW